MSTRERGVRKVVPPAEVAHLWAHQHQDEARVAHGSFYFKGRRIYSYGSHFEIARICDHDSHYVLWRDATYSVSTSRHQSYVRSAASHKTFIPVVEMFDFSDRPTKQKPEWVEGTWAKVHQANMYHITRKIDALYEAIDKPRTRPATNEARRSEIEGLRQRLREYVAFTGIDKDKGVINKELQGYLSGTMTEEEMAALRKKDREAKARKEAARKKAILKENAERIEKWKLGEGRDLSYLGMDYDLLRVKSVAANLAVHHKSTETGDRLAEMHEVKNTFIETSLGVIIQYEDAKALFEGWRKVVESGGNGKQLVGRKIDERYSISAYDSSVHAIKANCHNIKYEEALRIAKQEGWVK